MVEGEVLGRQGHDGLERREHHGAVGARPRQQPLEDERGGRLRRRAGTPLRGLASASSHVAVGGRAASGVQRFEHVLSMNWLRSGLFFAPELKAAAAAIRARMGGRYVVVHVRRGDKLRDEGGFAARVAPALRDNLTRPAAILRALELWGFARGSTVYVASSDERAPFFLSLIHI